MTTRTARCACDRLQVTVEGEPKLVLVCHCDFCQRRSGNVFIASAHFAEEQIVEVSGATGTYNGLVVDGVGAVGVPGGIDYHFCTTCGSTVYWVSPSPIGGPPIVAVAVGNFVDPDFPPPATEMNTKDRHRWVPPFPGATQVHDPLDGSMSLEAMVPSFRLDNATD